MSQLTRQQMQAAIKRYAEMNPEKFEALRLRAKAEHAAMIQKQSAVKLAEERRYDVMRAGRTRFQQALMVVDTPSVDLSGVIGMLAFRQWNVHDDGMLHSTIYDQYVWTNVMIANRVPEPHNTSGLYCVKLDPWSFMTRAEYYLGGVCGLIELRGKVVEHTDGILRAEWARILCILVVQCNAEVYGIVPGLYSNYPCVPIFVTTERKVTDFLFRVTVLQELKGEFK